MSLDSDPEITAAFSNADAASTPQSSSDDPEIKAAFSSKNDDDSSGKKSRSYIAGTPLGHFAAIGENVLSGITGGAGSLADAVTGSDPGTHDWGYRPRTDEGKALSGALSKGQNAVVNDVSKLGGSFVGLASNPANAQAATDTLRERIPEALGAAGTVAGVGGAIRGIGVPLDAAESSLPISADQAAREAVLRRVGVPEARVSALQGDASAAANDYQEAKLTSPNGLRMKSVIDNERQALSNHADSIVEGTGGTPGSAADQATSTERGNNILAPLDALKDHFDSATSSLYKEADTRAGGAPSQLSGFQDILKDNSELTNSDRVHLVGGLNSYLGKLKMVGEDDSISGNPKQAETVRKYLNENWSPQNSKLVGKLKDALDDDVTQSAGSDIYAQARAMRTMRGNTLDNPNGIAKLMDASGPNGINRSVPTEKVPDAITSMPVDQLNHIVGTLKNLPPDLQESGNLALSEIKAHMASKIADAGQSTSGMWNAKGVNQMLTKNSSRMQSIFDPDELDNFKDLRDAGDILKKDQSYPGAAVQEHNLMQRGAMAAMRGGSAALGAHIGGPIGAAAGEALGGNLATRYSAKAALKNVEARIKTLD